MNIWTDICVNLTNKRFDNDREQVIQDAVEKGVKRMLVVGTCLESSQKAVELCAQYPQYLRATAGCHPHDAKTMSAQSWEQLSALFESPYVIAIGECGLDFNRNFSEPEIQLEVFSKQLELALQHNLPVLLHERDAYKEMLSLLAQHPKLKKVIHCFTGSEEQVQGYLELNCYVGITGWICDERRNAELQGAIDVIPNERLLIETDAPYLLPRTLKPKPAKGRCEPIHIEEVSQQLAALKNIPHDVLVAITTLNSTQLFDWPIDEAIL
ncbi:MAG: TatD family hydrolase [Gammaproteobacteria bacterium]|nr:TatD family hydrolase [Gammaproteobacteria bacterium]NVK88062.1 TatD family hydrolase [Gammaproteobacteria bacterium]